MSWKATNPEDQWLGPNPEEGSKEMHYHPGDETGPLPVIDEEGELERSRMAAKLALATQEKAPNMVTMMVIVDQDQDTVRLLGQRPTDKSLANIAAAVMQEIVRRSKSEANKERAAEVLKALGVTRVEEIPSN